MWELDCEESWVLKNWWFWIVVLEKTLESPLDCKEIQPVYPKGDQSWVFIGRTDAEAETPIFLPPDVKNWLIWKDPSAGKDWGQEGKGMTKNGMVGWHHRLNGHGFGWTPGVSNGQGGLACCGSCGRKELDTTKRLNWLMSWLLQIALQCTLECMHLFELWLSLGICPEWVCWIISAIIWSLYFSFLRTLHTVLHIDCTNSLVYFFVKFSLVSGVLKNNFLHCPLR